MKIIRYALSAVALAGGLLTPASAGTEDDPEVRGENCRTEVIQVGGEYTVCKAWFNDAPSTVAATAISTTVQVAGDLEGRLTPIRAYLTWGRSGGCREGWQVTDTVGGPRQVEVFRACPGAEVLRVALDPARASFKGDTLRMDVTADDLAALGSGLKPGDRLARPVAGTRLVIRPTINNIGEVSTLGGDTPPGRDFVLPEAG